MSGGGHTLSLTVSQVASTCNSATTAASANLIKGVLTVHDTTGASGSATFTWTINS